MLGCNKLALTTLANLTKLCIFTWYQKTDLGKNSQFQLFFPFYTYAHNGRSLLGLHKSSDACLNDTSYVPGKQDSILILYRMPTEGKHWVSGQEILA